MLLESVQDWRALLVTISVFNILAWTLAWVRTHRRAGQVEPAVVALRRTLLLLSAGYVLGCAYRSWLPVYDIPRVVMVDHWLSSVLLGRGVATLAELCFVAQCALLLRAAGRSAGNAVAQMVAGSMVPIALVAETCSWYSVLSTSNLGHVFEESLWGLGATLWIAGLLSMWQSATARMRGLFALCAAVGIGYVAFMFTVDVPMYWSRWLADEAAGRVYLDIAAGLHDVASRWTVSTSWQHWRGEVAWMTMYFSVAVWLSIALVHVPLPAVAQPRSPA